MVGVVVVVVVVVVEDKILEPPAAQPGAAGMGGRSRSKYLLIPDLSGHGHYTRRPCLALMIHMPCIKAKI
eukprot:scaffold5737_cov25-Cyclotella_meneghiniana.AAC.2